MVTSAHHLSATMVTGRIHRMTELFARLAPGKDLNSARAELEDPVDLTRQRVGQARLREERVTPGRPGAGLGTGERMAADCDHRNRASSAVALQRPRDLPAVDTGNREVHHDEIRRMGASLVEGVVAVHRRGHLEAFELQKHGVDPPVVLDIVDDQDRLWPPRPSQPHPVDITVKLTDCQSADSRSHRVCRRNPGILTPGCWPWSCPSTGRPGERRRRRQG